jgi:hypothetical protein
MKKYLLLLFIFSGILCKVDNAQTISLSAVYDANNSAVKLKWNMVNSTYRTGYLLLKSADGVTWTEAAKDRMQRYYTNQDIYLFSDRNFLQGRNYYRIKISDANNNTVALSPVVVVITGGSGIVAKTPVYTKPQNTVQQQNQIKTPIKNTASAGNNSWIIYPNPATDILKLSYRGSGDLKGVVNVQIQDETGKVVIKFRSGSMYKNIEIPISNLRRGAYFIQVSVQNEMMMSQRFIKQ